MTTSERSQELLRNLIFLNEFEMGQFQKKGFDLMETTYFGQTCETEQIFPKSFAPQNELHSAKLRFSGALKHFLRK